MTLKISSTLSLPLDAATQTFGILAKRGAGKSNAAVVMAEEMHRAGIPWVAVDPKGDWWGMRSSADGKSAGLPLPVFGGEHGDIPLEPTAGALIADLVVDERLTCVLDVSTFSKGEQRRFLLAFAERLIRRNTEPLHLFLEEAHEYLPQRVMRDEAVLVGAWSKIVKQGRFRGLGCTLISQRSASLNKDVLTQVDSLIVMRTTAPQDRKAVEAWVVEHDVGHDLVESLPSLESGEAWIWSPEFLKATKRFRFRRRSTFDSGATPTIGATRQQVATLADVDLAAIKEQMAETIERAKADDPKALRAEIARLRKELTERPTEQIIREVEVRVEVPVPVVPDDVATSIVRLAEQLAAHNRAVAGEGVSGPGGGSSHLPAGRGVSTPRPTPSTSTPSRPEPRARAQSQAEAVMRALPADDVQLKAGARRIIDTLARHHPMRVTKAQLGTLTGFKITGGTFQTYYSTIKRHGLISERDGLIEITDSGLAIAGVSAAAPMTTEEVLDQWRRALKKGARDMLDVLVAEYPSSIDRSALAEQVEMTASGGTFQTYLATLRRNGLADVEGGMVTASASLFLGGAA